MVMIRPTCSVCIEKLAAMSLSRPTGINSVVLKIKAETARITTRNQAVERETAACSMVNKIRTGAGK